MTCGQSPLSQHHVGVCWKHGTFVLGQLMSRVYVILASYKPSKPHVRSQNTVKHLRSSQFKLCPLHGCMVQSRIRALLLAARTLPEQLHTALKLHHPYLRSPKRDTHFNIIFFGRDGCMAPPECWIYILSSASPEESCSKDFVSG